MPLDRAQAQAFFERYRDAFNRLDGDAVAELWHGSSGITDSRGPQGLAQLTWWPTDEPMRANHHALCQLYRQADYGRADFELLEHVPMGPNHAFTHLHWVLQRKDGSPLQQFHTGYQLVRTAEGLRVLLAVAHQENLAEMKPHVAQ